MDLIEDINVLEGKELFAQIANQYCPTGLEINPKDIVCYSQPVSDLLSASSVCRLKFLTGSFAFQLGLFREPTPEDHVEDNEKVLVEYLLYPAMSSNVVVESVDESTHKITFSSTAEDGTLSPLISFPVPAPVKKQYTVTM